MVVILMLELFTKEAVAAFLYDKRREKGMTGQEVSDKLKLYGIEISKTTIWGYEKGVSGPTVSTFLALCRIYEVDDVISDVKAQQDSVQLKKREKDLLGYFRQASPEAQELALKMLKPEEQDTGSMVG
jgi:transcriptional regulator with XRE-family HTH domain